MGQKFSAIANSSRHVSSSIDLPPPPGFPLRLLPSSSPLQFSESRPLIISQLRRALPAQFLILLPPHPLPRVDTSLTHPFSLEGEIMGIKRTHMEILNLLEKIQSEQVKLSETVVNLRKMMILTALALIILIALGIFLK
ncbi:hypothetical protein V6N13_119853 [Hibiscus sabdariffa]|uniref:Uncharacterized protein n=1 Tax=Hibiscus sabdariffa TaxID=183260 RepID=A0ABR2E2I5_9ROSI